MTVAATGPSPTARLAPLDWMRGLVMILMAIDHSSGAFNGGHLFTDAAFLYHAGAPLPVAQFLTRWITHLCAPTFLFLAGTGLAFTVAKQRERGVGARDIDHYIFARGLLIAPSSCGFRSSSCRRGRSSCRFSTASVRAISS